MRVLWYDPEKKMVVPYNKATHQRPVNKFAYWKENEGIILAAPKYMVGPPGKLDYASHQDLILDAATIEPAIPSQKKPDGAGHIFLKQNYLDGDCFSSFNPEIDTPVELWPEIAKALGLKL